jgi:hypothetical protein
LIDDIGGRAPGLRLELADARVGQFVGPATDPDAGDPLTLGLLPGTGLVLAARFGALVRSARVVVAPGHTGCEEQDHGGR